MLLYLDLSYAEAKAANRLNNLGQLRDAIMDGAAKRLRPKFMTFATTCIGLFPIMWSTGAGSDVMKRIAAPMIGGIFSSFVLELLVYPCNLRTMEAPHRRRESGSPRIVGISGRHAAIGPGVVWSLGERQRNLTPSRRGPVRSLSRGGEKWR